MIAPHLQAERLARLPKPEFDPALPVNGRREEIAQAIQEHQVVVICGETGSGKTTQIPKILLQMQRGIHGWIGHTQPRRIAARSVAARIAQELNSELGAAVGYKVRFLDKVKRESYIKLMTDGILLAETQGDPELRAYDTIIIDEAHERSLNIDFLLGYLRNLLPRRADLKLIITSATIDADKFSQHFCLAGKAAPVIEVSGRLYPVEVRYRPVAGDAEDTTRDEEESALVDAVAELCNAGPGDILVFLPGEREIRETMDILKANLKTVSRSPVDLLPLFSRLSNAEQDRVFRPAGNARRIVLATNVAETSLTVPGIRYVVDTGYARVKRYSYRNKVEQLRVEKISQASAKQRAGRCGRVADGICIRLYDEDDYQARPAFTDPEVLRSSLAAVILRAKGLHLGDPAEFPFVDPPQPKAIADGYALLNELGAVGDDNELTVIGRELARLPLDPRIARMLFAAQKERCLGEVLVIAAALSVQDPRERPMDKQAAADQAQLRFDDERSDFLAYLKLWKFFGDALAEKLSNNKLAARCRQHFLSIARMREWREVHTQLRAQVEELGWKPSSVDAAKLEGFRAIHRALLTGLLGNIGMKAEDDAAYTGARGIKFWPHPGSGTKKPGRWIMAAELTETTRLFARCVAAIEPLWLEELGAHLMKKSRDNPHWEKTRAQVVAVERGTLYGLPVYANRRVHYGPMDPEYAREVFIRQALVEGGFETRAPFFAHNQKLIHEIERLEHKSRRPDILVDDALINAFYASRIPAGIHNGADFEKWRKEAERDAPKLLFLSREDLMRHEAAGITTGNFPPTLRLGANEFGLEYHFDPGTPKDGITMSVPVALLNQVSAARCDWLVPGLLKDKVQTLAKSIPQRLRHKLGSLAEFAEDFVATVKPSDTPLATAISRHIRLELHLDVPLDAFRPDSAPPHLAMNYLVIDEHGRQLAMGRNLAELKTALREQTEAVLQDQAPMPEGERFTGWTFGDLEEMMELARGGHTLVGYPALVDAGDAVTLQVVDSPENAREIHRGGVRRLLSIALKERIRDLDKTLARDALLGPVKEDIVSAALDRTFLAESLPMRARDFAVRAGEGRNRLTLIAQEIMRLATAVLTEQRELQKRLVSAAKGLPIPADDVRQQLARLLAPHFIAQTPYARLQHFPRYLKAAGLRLEKLRGGGSEGAARDARLMAEFAPLHSAWQRDAAGRSKQGTMTDEIEQFRWLLEELRVSLFAQELRTPVPVSVKRLAKLWQTLR